jgi:hypothetical protein
MDVSLTKKNTSIDLTLAEVIVRVMKVSLKKAIQSIWPMWRKLACTSQKSISSFSFHFLDSSVSKIKSSNTE